MVTLEQVTEAKEKLTTARSASQEAQAALALATSDYKALSAAWEAQRKEAGRAMYARNMEIAAQRAVARSTPTDTAAQRERKREQLAGELALEYLKRFGHEREAACWWVEDFKGVFRKTSDESMAASMAMQASKKWRLARVHATPVGGERTLIYSLYGTP